MLVVLQVRGDVHVARDISDHILFFCYDFLLMVLLLFSLNLYQGMAIVLIIEAEADLFVISPCPLVFVSGRLQDGLWILDLIYDLLYLLCAPQDEHWGLESIHH